MEYINSLYNLQDLKDGFFVWTLIWLYLQITPLLIWIDNKYDEILESQILPGWGNQLLTVIWLAIDCHKCLSFWLILIYTGNPLVAISFALLSSVLAKKTSR
jgi:hypothetical protein